MLHTETRLRPSQARFLLWQPRQGARRAKGKKPRTLPHGNDGKMVRVVGLEPTLLAEKVFETFASTVPPHPHLGCH